MNHHLALVVGIVVLALAFDFINGFHDAANSIATVVSTRVLTPRRAVLLAAFFNFISFKFFEMHVATTVGKGILDPSVVDLAVITGALSGAVVWNLATWWWGLPSSSSHALVGGLIGAGVSKGGMSVLLAPKIIQTALFIVVSPALGLVLGGSLMVAVAWLFRRNSPGRIDRWFRRMQLVSASLYSLGHGANDAQKTMGIIAVLLFSEGYLGKTFPKGNEFPTWIILSCQVAMGLGTLSGGWRIVKTMGLRLTKLKPFGGFCAETGGAITLFIASQFGIPVSTTHTITGAIVGVGGVARPGSVRWGIATRIVWAWIFTIPVSAFLAALAYAGVHACGM